MSPIGPELVAAALALNSPSAPIASTVRRLSPKWFLAIHLPIPLIFVLRVSAGYGYSFIPWLFVGAVGGQLVGARLWHLVAPSIARRPTGATPEDVPASSLLAGCAVTARPSARSRASGD